MRKEADNLVFIGQDRANAQTTVLDLTIALFVGLPIGRARAVTDAEHDRPLDNFRRTLVGVDRYISLFAFGIITGRIGDRQGDGVGARCLVDMHRILFAARTAVAKVPSVSLNLARGLLFKTHFQRCDTLLRNSRKVGLYARTDYGQRPVGNGGRRLAVIEQYRLYA